ncbi:MAG: hypothetical protein LBR73_07265 [Oscillospiraceae bacterium]|jgi:hypothetical protein|nr:hypothetical protein [Oscillospiraceae bacterium]
MPKKRRRPTPAAKTQPLRKAPADLRMPRYDNVRGLVMYIVILSNMFLGTLMAHSEEPGKDYALLYILLCFGESFSMQLFVFCAGYFGRRYLEQPERMVHRLFDCTAMFLFARILAFVAQAIAYGSLFRFPYFLSMDFYMLAMGLWLLAVYPFRKLPPWVLIPAAFVLGCLLIILPGTWVQTNLIFKKFLFLLPFFAVGLFWKDEYLDILSPYNQKVVGSTGAIAVLLFLSRLPQTYRAEFVYSEESSAFLTSDFVLWQRPLLRLGVYAVSVLSCLCVLLLLPRGRVPLLTAAGGRTLQIYVFHIFFVLLYNVRSNPLKTALLNIPLGWAVVCALGITFVVWAVLSLKPVGIPLLYTKKASDWAANACIALWKRLPHRKTA